VERLIAGGWRGSAIACVNDMVAIGAMAALTAAGLRVPEDVSVAGYDDLPADTWVHPAVTTVRPPTADIASRAVTALVAQLNGLQLPDLSGATALAPRLVVRGSTAPCTHGAAPDSLPDPARRRVPSRRGRPAPILSSR
jgi:DNA-binding LacI/PurR family transcriptional regulator